MDEKERYENPHNHEEYTDKEVRRIAYMYMDYKIRIRMSLCVGLPVTLIVTLMFVIYGVTSKLALFYGLAGLFGALAIFIIIVNIHAYKIYKNEEQRLRDEYGDEFLERATWFKKRKND